LLAPGIAVTAAGPASPDVANMMKSTIRPGNALSSGRLSAGTRYAAAARISSRKVPGRVAEMVAQALAEA
jgi:hypothetical protein